MTKKTNGARTDAPHESWSELNAWLLSVADETALRARLGSEVASGRATRAMRVYGRLSKVRREREVAEVRADLTRRKAV